MDFTEIINALLALIAAVITGFVLPWLKTKLSKEQAETLKFWVDMAVKAAEQYFGSGTGAQKKQFALDWLAEKNIKVDEAMIEAAVYEHFNSVKTDFDLLGEVEKEAKGIPVELEQGVG